MITRSILIVLFFMLSPRAFAQDSGQSSSDSGVLVSGNEGSGGGMELSAQDNSGKRGDDSAPPTSTASTDPIIIKATNAMMFQITANMKLSQDQINTVQPIIMKYIVKVRDLQQSLEKGDIDSKAMYDQRAQFYRDEDKELSRIFSPDQMNIWANIQNP